MNSLYDDDYFRRYCSLKEYVGWSERDRENVLSVKTIVEPEFATMVDDFYQAIERTPSAMKVLTGGKAQIARLKKSLMIWLDQLFSGVYDQKYVMQRLQVGRRHVEIGLDQVYTNVALSRLRSQIHATLVRHWSQSQQALGECLNSVNRLLDLDLSLIEDAFQMAFAKRQKREERYATIGKVSGGIAHEIRNPLNVIQTSIYFLLNANSIGEEKRIKHLERIDGAIKSANNIVSALSDFARLPEPRLMPQSIRKIVDDAIRMHVPAEPSGGAANVVVENHLEDDSILGESAQLMIAFGNLIRNALQAIGPNGEVRVRTEDRGGKKTLVISDNGTGISRENLDSILEPLFTTKPRGIGLGLAITKAILSAHQAELTVSSIEGEGSEFAVLFPIREDTTEGLGA